MMATKKKHSRANGVRSREKGKAYELTVAAALRALYPGAKRGNAQYRNESSYDDHKPDVEGTPWWVETSHGRSPSITGKLVQATLATDGRLCIAVTRINRGKDIASVYLPDLLALLRDVEVLRELRAQPAMEKLLELAEHAVKQRGLRVQDAKACDKCGAALGSPRTIDRTVLELCDDCKRER